MNLQYLALKKGKDVAGRNVSQIAVVRENATDLGRYNRGGSIEDAV
jgi:hypothetical protein